MTAAGPGVESVWDYPRPPAVRSARGTLVEVWFAGMLIASTTEAVRVLETSHPPVYYLPADDVATDILRAGDGSSVCEWKGHARYWDAQVGERRAERVAWSYPRPEPAYRELTGRLAFYPGRVDLCTVDGETVHAQEGDFYGGWITGAIIGPFKGAPGTAGW
ncbi:DUF427 domain-containing protein [Kitasatospora sp. NPDC094015]|uniref:DUF427 domain-containing protein n=1 Tax=Kitasatospora sp. NPDC094015 TaxID=3155205 RepID=UPI003323DFC1